MKDCITLTIHMRDAFDEIEKRFIHKSTGLPLNYTGLDGTVILPSEEEVEQGKPSMLSWNCPIEDGAYYGGLYLSALVNLALYSDIPVKTAAKRVANGLISLSETETDGFVARNYIGDKKVHYAIGSNDQTFPWFYGLWMYYRSNIPTNEEKANIKERLSSVALALEKLDWKIPSDPLSVGFRGDYKTKTVNDVAKLLFIHRAMYELTSNDEWLDKYHKYLNSYPDKSDEKRIDILRRGAAVEEYDHGSVFYCIKDGEAAEEVFGQPVSLMTYPFFTKAMVDIALRALIDMETDDDIKEAYNEGLLKDAEASLSHIERYKGFDISNAPRFSLDWRAMNVMWKPHNTANEAHEIAWSQMSVWFRECPRFPYENAFVREPLYAGFVSVLGRAEVSSSDKEKIIDMLNHYPWEKLNTSTFYVALCLYGQMLANEQAQR